MRGMLFTSLTLIVHATAGQHVRLSEVMPTSYEQQGWIELFNAGPRTQHLDDWALVIQDQDAGSSRTFRFPEGSLIAPRQYLLLRRSVDGLPRIPGQGSILLLAADKRSVLDIFSWPQLPSGNTACRCYQNDAGILFSIKPSPGTSTPSAACERRLLRTPEVHMNASGVVEAKATDAELRFTTDGSEPTKSSPLFIGPVTLTEGTMITLRAFAPDAVPSTCASCCLPSGVDERTIALRIAPADLTDLPRGLLDSRRVQKGGKSRSAEVMAELMTMDGGVHRSESDRLSVAGSGTRGLPKKSFKVRRSGPVNDPILGPWPEVMLRADASPNAFLHNLFMEHAMKVGAHLEMQPSLPVMLKLNGRSIGLYRAMPAKNSDWLMSLCGAEDVDIVDGPAANAVHGNDERFVPLLAALERGAPIDSLERMMDVMSLLDLACADLWTGRADHDLNMRAWRPRDKDGRWRFILFDMDLWAPAEEHTIDRMCSETAPVSPWLPWLFENATTRDALLARMSAWLATAFSPAEASVLLDSLFNANEAMMRADHERWSDTLNMLEPDEAVRSIKDHIANRTRPLVDQLAHKSGKKVRAVEVSVAPSGSGWIDVEDLVARSAAFSVPAFRGIPVHLSAHPCEGYEFVQWQGAKCSGPKLVLDGDEGRVKAVFRPVGRTSK